MPLLGIATAQKSLQNSPLPVFPQSFFHRRFKFPAGDLKKQGTRLKIRAAATLEPEPLFRRENGTDDLDLESSLPTHAELREDWVDLDETERMRRVKISKANKGLTPWNKGKTHSEETRNRISEKTRLAMQDPKIRMKLMCLGRARSFSEETRLRIGLAVRIGHRRRRERLMSQQAWLFEWQNLVAEASRKGLLGEDELQWDSHEVLTEQSKREWVEIIKQRKTMPGPRGNKRAPKSPEQKKKIAAAIAAKWTDPIYRERVKSGKAKLYGITDEAERKPKKNPSGIGNTQSPEGRVPQERSLVIRMIPQTIRISGK